MKTYIHSEIMRNDGGVGGDVLSTRKIFIKSIHSRLTLYFSILIIVFTLIITFIISKTYYLALVEQTRFIVEQNINSISSDIDGKVSYIKNISSSLRTNEKITQLIKKEYTMPEEEFVRNTEISDIISSYTDSSNGFVRNILVIDKNNNILNNLYSSKMYKDIILENPYFLKFKEHNYFIKVSSPITLPQDSKDNESLMMYIQYFDKEDYDLLGYVIMAIKKNILFADIDEECSTMFDYAFIINTDGDVIYSTIKPDFNFQINEVIDLVEKNKTEALSINHKKYMVANRVLKNHPDWQIVGVIADDKMMQKINQMNMGIVLIGVVCVFAVIGISFIISKKITNPIAQIKAGMSKLKYGNWPQKIVCQSEDELKDLVEGFNKMVMDLKKLIHDIKTEQEAKKKAELAALQFELEALQYQINPHFIHNTLNAVSGMAIRDKNDDIKDLIQSLNLLLRTTMTSSGKEYITIMQELECIKSYLRIHEYRYDNNVQLAYDIDDEIKHFKIPRLLLQPIIENAIFHGIIPKEKRGTIRIVFVKNEDCLLIKIIDDGVGIKKENLASILQGNESNTRGFNNIGLANVNNRLKLYFGNQSELKIHSRVGIGTSVEFIIPIIKD